MVEFKLKLGSSKNKVKGSVMISSAIQTRFLSAPENPPINKPPTMVFSHLHIHKVHITIQKMKQTLYKHKKEESIST